jgi:uncharacterized protein YfdQ (DUF2303 family)
MSGMNLKQRLLRDIKDLPAKKIQEVIDFVEYLKLKEDNWFIDYVNKRASEAKTQKKAGRMNTNRSLCTCIAWNLLLLQKEI